MSFTAFDLHPSLLRAVADLGFTRPTPIQREAIPAALAGRDLVGGAMTGSGKTAAFALPVLQRLLARPGRGPRALVLAPTRELAQQILDVFNALGRHTRLTAAAVYGGVGMEPQERALRRGVDVIVACPGRLLDHMQYPYADLSRLEVVVLDEADRMLDMGFLPDLKRVLAKVPPAAQKLLFSATLPAPIRDLARTLLHEPVSVQVAGTAAPATGVKQTVFPVRQDHKVALLVELLRRSDGIANALVFTRTKHRANRLADQLDRQGIACERVHGNRSQAQRTAALAGFKSGRYRVLVATDVAARGIDIEALSHVVNFDVPAVADDYIHRVGRTARNGATGEAFTFVAPEEQSDLGAIERAVGRRLDRRTLEGFDYQARPAEKLEIPLAERIAAIRARKSEERQRAAANAARRAEAAARAAGRPTQSPPAARPAGQGAAVASHRAPGRPSRRPARPAFSFRPR
ncbi:MAG: DEAD/DEAH box helicase [Thermoanaerobaculia bacterium]|nr:DEAD/DEAH box helicase [Thermoanaerobaculia bacterium]